MLKTQNSGITGIKPKYHFLARIMMAILGGMIILLCVSFWKAFSYYRLGEENLKGGNYEIAILAFEQSILNHFPASPFYDKSLQKLLQIGKKAYQENNISIALQAFHAVIFSNASLSFYRNKGTNFSSEAIFWLKKINPNWIADNMPYYFPNKFWSLSLGIFLLLWIFSVFTFILKGFDEKGKIKLPNAFLFAALFAVSVIFWILSIKLL